MFDWLNVINAQLSPERYKRGPRSKEVGGRRGRPYLTLIHCHHQNDSALRWVAMRAILMLR